MPGTKISVLEVEKLHLTKDGRGFYVSDDGDICASNTWTGKSLSGARFLPAASATAWLKLTRVSGASGTETTGYIPVFQCFW